MPSEIPGLSAYALCEVEDVAELLGYTDQQTSNRQRTLVRVINGATTAIRRRSQREFKQTDAEKAKTRFVEIHNIDVARGYVRLGDYAVWPTEVKLWSPNRDTSVDLNVADDGTGDLWPLPDAPEPGLPFEYLKIKTTAATLYQGAWLSVKTDWGFAEIPDDIIQVAIGTAALWVLNDVAKLTELSRQQSRPIKLQSMIPSEFLETVDSYRLYRVA